MFRCLFVSYSFLLSVAYALRPDRARFSIGLSVWVLLRKAQSRCMKPIQPFRGRFSCSFFVSACPAWQPGPSPSWLTFYASLRSSSRHLISYKDFYGHSESTDPCLDSLSSSTLPTYSLISEIHCIACFCYHTYWLTSKKCYYSLACGQLF